MKKRPWMSLLIFCVLCLFWEDQITVAAPVVLYSSDFEANNGGMTGSLDWEWGEYDWDGTGCYNTSNIPPPSAHSGSHMWGTILNTCYQDLGNNADSCNNINPSDDSILSFTVNLTGVSSATLSWWEWNDLFLDWDWAEVYVNSDVVFQRCTGGRVPPTAWEERIIDLSSYVGSPVTISFHMMSSTVVNYAGWYIDDVQVMAVTSETTAIPTLSEWGIIFMSLILAVSAIWMIRRRQTA